MMRQVSLRVCAESEDSGRCRLPEWVRRPPGSVGLTRDTKLKLRKFDANTVCEQARCPNIAECFGNGTAAFMILGTVCTRRCRFCAVSRGKPTHRQEEMQKDAYNVANAASVLGLKHVVVTSVTRDDLQDGGAMGFVMAINAIREVVPDALVEVLIPDFNGDNDALYCVLEVSPDVLNHNLETVSRLYPLVRPDADFNRSLNILKQAAHYRCGEHYCERNRHKRVVKTGFMCGMGETELEMIEAMQQAYEAGARVCTLGQYLQPTRGHLPVHTYISPAQFETYKEEGEKIGFNIVNAGALVRSSYHASMINHMLQDFKR